MVVCIDSTTQAVMTTDANGSANGIRCGGQRAENRSQDHQNDRRVPAFGVGSHGVFGIVCRRGRETRLPIAVGSLLILAPIRSRGTATSRAARVAGKITATPRHSRSVAGAVGWDAELPP